MPEFNSHLDVFELFSLIRCGRNSAYETGLRDAFADENKGPGHLLGCRAMHLKFGSSMVLQFLCTMS